MQKLVGKQITTNLILPMSLAEALDRQASEEGTTSRAAMIRRACLHYLREQGSNSEGMAHKEKQSHV